MIGKTSLTNNNNNNNNSTPPMPPVDPTPTNTTFNRPHQKNVASPSATYHPSRQISDPQGIQAIQRRFLLLSWVLPSILMTLKLSRLFVPPIISCTCKRPLSNNAEPVQLVFLRPLPKTSIPRRHAPLLLSPPAHLPVPLAEAQTREP